MTKSLTPTRKPTQTATKPPTFAPIRIQVTSPTVAATPTMAPIPIVATPFSMGQTYNLLSVHSSPGQVRPGDVNLTIRGFVPISATRRLVDYDGQADGSAPQLAGLFVDNRTPVIAATYQVYDWKPSCDCRGDLVTDYDVTLVALDASPGEIIRVPDSGYEIGSGFEALVVYADDERIVLTYTASDSVIRGYALYVQDLAVDGDLVTLYRQASSAGRTQLPALRSAQPFGKAKGNELRVAIRDSGAFMDPRSRKDWWRGR